MVQYTDDLLCKLRDLVGVCTYFSVNPLDIGRRAHVYSRFVGTSTSMSPADDAVEDPFAVFVANQRTTIVTLNIEITLI